MMREWMPLVILFAGLIAWNMIDDASRNLWLHGDTRGYAERYFPGSSQKLTDGGCTCP